MQAARLTAAAIAAIAAETRTVITRSTALRAKQVHLCWLPLVVRTAGWRFPSIGPTARDLFRQSVRKPWEVVAPTRILLNLTALMAVIAVTGCGEEDTDLTGSKLVSYTADAGSAPEEVFESSGLSIEAACSEDGALTVTATTAADDASLTSEFRAKHSPPEGYRFVLDDFDSAFGPYDFLGTGPEEASGTLQYSAARGSHVTILFTADGSQSEGCAFSGTAVTPADIDEPNQDSSAPTTQSSRTTPTDFESCPPPSSGGGDDVWVQGMNCAAVTTKLLLSMPDAFGRYKSLPEAKRQVSTDGPDGWMCWSALESDFGPIFNTCRRADQTLIFYEG